MRILYIHEVNYLKKVIFEMHEFPELLSLRSNTVSFFEFPERQFDGIHLKTSSRQIDGRVYPKSTLNLITPPNFGGYGFERYFAPITAFFSLNKILRSKSFDVIVLLSVPTSGWQAVLLANKYKIPIVFRALDVSHKIRSTVLAPLIKICEQFIYKNVDVLSANTPAMEKYCISISGRTKPSFVNLPPVDLSHFFELGTPIDRGTLGLTEKDKVILYMGTFFEFSGLIQIVEDFSRAAKANPQLRLLLVGGGVLDKALREKVQKLGLDNQVIFTGVVPYSELPGYLQVADVAINPFEKQLLTDVALPHKVLQYMASGVPAVSTSLEGLRSVLGEDSGVTWCSGPTEIIHSCNDLLSKPNSFLNNVKDLQKKKIISLFEVQTVTDSMQATIATAIENKRPKSHR